MWTGKTLLMDVSGYDRYGSHDGSNKVLPETAMDSECGRDVQR